MSEELLQRNLVKNPEKIGKWDFYNIGATTVKALKEYGIIRNVNYGKIEKKKVDAIIVQKKNVIAIIEYKKPSQFKTKDQQNKAIKQEIEVAKKLGSKIIIATDTKDTVWVNVLTGKRIKDEEGKEIKTLFNPKDEKITDLIKKIYDSIDENNNQITPPKLINPTDLAKSIWQDIWSVSGESPTNCLYTFVELFIFKYLSDLKILGQGINFDSLMERFKYDIKNPNEEALDYYAKTIRLKIKKLFPYNPIDNTTIINGTVFVNEDDEPVMGYSTVFKKVLEKFDKYGKLENIHRDFKSQLFEQFLKEGISKKNLGQFFTPLEVVRSIVKMAKDDVKEGIKICDPACGVGKFLLELLVTKFEDFYKITKKGIIPKITIHGFDKGFDRDEQKTIILAKANMLIYFSDLIKDNPGQTEHFAKLFNESFTLKTNSILGTLSEPIQEKYDLILTNPPYVTSGSSNLKEEIKKNGNLTDYYKISAKGLEGLFIEWIIRSLKLGGKAFVVIPDGILGNQNKNLKQFLLDECYIDGIISLPLNTFFTTNKKTYILAITKKVNKKNTQKDPVFTYLVSEIGESRDIYRFNIDQNDLQEAVALYSFFKGNKKGFEKINSDKRCKIQPFNKFKENIKKSWIIDKWWSEKEKVDIGIVEKKEKVTVLEFASIIENIANSIKGFQEEVKELSEKKKIEIEYKSFILEDLFDIEKGLSKYTKKYGNQNKGKFPVFSASNIAPLTHISTFDFDGEYLTWATNGFAGYIKIISGKFSINADRGLLKPKKENLNIKYVKYKLEPILRKLAKGRKGEKGEDEFTKVYPSMLSDIKIDLPINSNGEIDLFAQNKIVEKIIFIEEVKQKVEEYKKKINKLNVEIKNVGGQNKSVKIRIFFDIISGFAFKKSMFTGNQTDIPIIRIQNISDKNPKFIFYPSSEKIDEKFLVKKGDFLLPLSGSFFRLTEWQQEGKFYLNQRIAKFFMKKEFLKKLDEEFVKTMINIIEDNIYQMGYSANNNLRINDVKDIEIFVPINKKGEFDLKVQKQMAEKYKKIEQIKLAINIELNKITEIKIDFLK